jgi:hypothetical protein
MPHALKQAAIANPILARPRYVEMLLVALQTPARTGFAAAQNRSGEASCLVYIGAAGDPQTMASGTDLNAYHYAMLDYDAETGHAQLHCTGKRGVGKRTLWIGQSGTVAIAPGNPCALSLL